VAGDVTPGDVTVYGNELLAALTVAGGERMDPGPARDLLWHGELPARGRWQLVDELPAHVLSDLADRGVTLARDNVGPHGTPPASLMDQAVLTVTGGELEVKVQMRCLFALSGMGFLDSGVEGDIVRVTATDSWMRIDARYGGRSAPPPRPPAAAVLRFWSVKAPLPALIAGKGPSRLTESLRAAAEGGRGGGGVSG